MHELADAVSLDDDLFEFTGEVGLDLVKERSALGAQRGGQLREHELLAGAPVVSALREVLVTEELDADSDVIVSEAT